MTQKWEFKTVVTTSGGAVTAIDDKGQPLNNMPLRSDLFQKLGQEGWKLVAMAIRSSGPSDQWTELHYGFKRPLEGISQH